MRTRPDAISELAVGDRIVHLDELGFLVDPSEWDNAVAEALAGRQNGVLTEDHWNVIGFIAHFRDCDQLIRRIAPVRRQAFRDI